MFVSVCFFVSFSSLLLHTTSLSLTSKGHSSLLAGFSIRYSMV